MKQFLLALAIVGAGTWLFLVAVSPAIDVRPHPVSSDNPADTAVVAAYADSASTVTDGAIDSAKVADNGIGTEDYAPNSIYPEAWALEIGDSIARLKMLDVSVHTTPTFLDSLQRGALSVHASRRGLTVTPYDGIWVTNDSTWGHGARSLQRWTSENYKGNTAGEFIQLRSKIDTDGGFASVTNLELINNNITTVTAGTALKITGTGDDADNSCIWSTQNGAGATNLYIDNGTNTFTANCDSNWFGSPVVLDSTLTVYMKAPAPAVEIVNKHTGAAARGLKVTGAGSGTAIEAIGGNAKALSLTTVANASNPTVGYVTTGSSPSGYTYLLELHNAGVGNADSVFALYITSTQTGTAESDFNGLYAENGRHFFSNDTLRVGPSCPTFLQAPTDIGGVVTISSPQTAGVALLSNADPPTVTISSTAVGDSANTWFDFAPICLDGRVMLGELTVTAITSGTSFAVTSSDNADDLKKFSWKVGRH